MKRFLALCPADPQIDTESDYRLDSDAQGELAARLKEEKAFDSSGKVVTLEYPVFIPAKGRARLKVKIPQAYPEHDSKRPQTNCTNTLAMSPNM